MLLALLGSYQQHCGDPLCCCVCPPPGVPQTAGNPAYLAQLADKVRQAEQEVLLATNFAMPNRYCQL